MVVMSWPFKTYLRSIILYIFPRYPFVNALTLLLLLAERADREKLPPFGANAIYANVALLFICAVTMGFNFARQVSAIVHAIQLICLAIVVYVDNTLQYRLAIRLRMAERMVGVAGFFLLFAFFSHDKPRPKLLRRLGEIAIGVYILLSVYSVLRIGEDREAFLKLVPVGSQVVLFIYATMLGCIGLCYLPGLFVYDMTQVLIVLVSLFSLVVDARMTYWTKRRALDYWVQVRLLADHVAIVTGCAMYLLCTRKKLPGGSEGGSAEGSTSKDD